MKRTLTAAIAAAGLALVGVAVAPAAQAITNPADHPYPITVKGDDGNTYTDGEDTLPGYDDVECTYIPGAYFDFDNDRVRYADGQSIPWTEWERATGYEEWKAEQNQPEPAPSPSAPKPGSPTKPGGTTSGGSTSTGSGSAGTRGGTGATGNSTSGSSSTDGPAVADDPATPEDESVVKTGTKKGAGPTDGPTGAAAPGTDDVVLSSGATESGLELDAASGESGGSAAGLLILGGLGGAALLTFAGYSVLGRRRTRGESVS